MNMKAVLSILAVTCLTGMASANNVGIVNTIPGTFTDISGTGTPLGLGDDSSANITTTVSNTLLAAVTQVTVSNNGGVAWGGTGTPGLAFTNASLLTGGVAFGSQRQALFPYWDDMFTPVGNVWHQTVGGVLIVQWTRSHFNFGSTATNGGTFQLKVFNGADGSVGAPWAQFIYSDTDFGSSSLNDGASATIGYQASAASKDVQWSFNTAGSAGPAPNGVLSLVAIPSPGALALLGTAGLIGSRRRRRT
jgi:hypothetical protein